MTRYKRLRSARALIGCAIALAVWIFATLPVRAETASPADDIQVHGFITQGYVDTSGNSFFGDSEDGSFEFTELGVNASYMLTPSVLLSGQLLSRRAGEMYDGSPTVDYALIDWNFENTEDHSYGVQVGRVKNTLGLYNDTRDVAFTRPSIFLPQQIYFDAVRNLFLSSDSVHLYGRWHTDLGQVSVNVGVGQGSVDKNVEISYLGADFGGHLEPRGASYLANAMFESAGGAWRFGLSAAKGNMRFDRDRTDPIGSGDLEFLFWVASAQYNAERWSLTAEYMEEPVDFDDFGVPLDLKDSTVQGYYLQGSYLIRDDLEWVVRYSEGYSEKDDHSGRELSALSGGLLPPHNFYQKDWMVGLRWDVTPSFMLRAEYQWTDGTWTLSGRENPDPQARDRDWEMFSLLGSYRF